ncbi:hypothetical protein HAX54_030846, partial [Datura stramonium]|nr:hypothetical protein [Datura stramonium]
MSEHINEQVGERRPGASRTRRRVVDLPPVHGEAHRSPSPPQWEARREPLPPPPTYIYLAKIRKDYEFLIEAGLIEQNLTIE